MTLLKKILTLAMTVCVFSTGFGTPAQAEDERAKAFLMSFLVPGLGQYYAGSAGYAKLFFGAELALWGGYYYNSTMKSNSRDVYFSYASLHAGVNPSGRGSSYLNNLGNYNSSYEYYGYMSLQDSDDVQYPPEMEWSWDDEENRRRFKQLREVELGYENNIKFITAAVLLNHFVSALHASNVARSMTHGGIVSFRPLHHGVAAAYTRSF